MIVFPLPLSKEIDKFGLPNWKNAEASFYEPATFGAKICRLREFKTTIQTYIVIFVLLSSVESHHNGSIALESS
jgi:hypothetical protein